MNKAEMRQDEVYKQLYPRSLAVWAGVSVVLLGSLVLTGWLWNIELLKTVVPGLVTMKANTAICVISAGISLLLLLTGKGASTRQHWLAKGLSWIVICAGLATLAEYVVGKDLGLDQALFRDSETTAENGFPGRMSPATALDFILLGVALLNLDSTWWRGKRWLAEDCTVLAGIITLLAFIGYFYGVETLYRVGPYFTIGLHTVVAIGLLCAGILFARPDRGIMALVTSDKLGGLVARRMLPAAILVPLIVGWLRVSGQRAGLYGLGFGSAVYATVLVVTFTTLVIYLAGVLNRADCERQEGERREHSRRLELEALTEQLSISRENLRGLAARLQAVREEERTRVAREIHDVLAQELTRLKMDISWLNRQLAHPPDAVKQQHLREKLAGMSELTDAAITSVQKIATELRPVVLDSLGLCAAIEWQARDFEGRTGIECSATAPDLDQPLERERSTALFRILQESLTNVARHAEATRVEIELNCQDGWVSLSVRDNGRGIRADELSDPRSVGLLGMRERAALLGGECHIRNSSQGGTVVEARLPVEVREAGRASELVSGSL